MQQESQNQNQNPEQQPQQQEKSKAVFVVSSAIHAKHGIYKTEERLAQTIETCKSIKERTGADVFVLDGGCEYITEEEQSQLNDHIDLFLSYAKVQQIQEIQQVPNHDIVKNMIEIMMYGMFFTEYKQKLIDGYDRVFKISGRYTLNDNFDLDFHMNQKDKIVIRGPYTTQFNAQITGGVVLQYMSRLWSFDSNLTSYITEVYQNMLAHMVDRLNNKGYIDIEHLLYEHLNSKIVVNPKMIGIQGNIAPNGREISE